MLSVIQPQRPSMKSILSSVPHADRAAGTHRGRWGCLALCSLLLALSATTTQAADATPPNLMTYQGFLVDANGNVLAPDNPANYPVVFRIYEGATGGVPLWSEQQIVTIDKGNFSVLLGEGTVFGSEPRPSIFTVFSGNSASDRYIGITVGGASTEILPRLRLLPAPYAYLARQANSLVDNSGNPLVAPGSGSELIVSGKVTANEVAGNGAALTALNASQLTSGSIPDGRLSANVALRNGGNTFNGNQTINNALGIGTTPFFRFHVADSGNLPAVIQSSSPVGTWLPLGNSSTGGRFWQMISSGSGNGEGAGKLLFGVGTSAGTTMGVRMTIQENGFVGIGTSFPTRPFHINGSAAIEGSNPIEFGRGFTKETSAGQIGYGTHSGGAGGSLDIVGAGTTGSNRRISMWAEGGLTLHGPIANGLVVNTGSGLTFQVLDSAFRQYQSNNKGKFFQMFRYDSGVALQGFGGGWGNASGDFRQITWDGDGNWDAASDRRLKKDIVDAEPMLDRALKVQIRRFRWKDDPDNAKLTMGVVAQELQPLFPDLIAEQPNPSSEENMLAVGYSDFGMIAIKALQELKAQHDEETTHLKSEIESLKSQVANLVRAQTALLERLDNGNVSTASARR